jgi:hypothetical protein
MDGQIKKGLYAPFLLCEKSKNLASLVVFRGVMVKYFRKEFKLLSLKFPYALQGFGNLAPS